MMLPLNVSFAIFAILPIGWCYDIFVLVLESFLASKILLGKKFDGRICLSVCIANLISGLIGFGLSLALTGGWVLVVWQPLASDMYRGALGPWGNFILLYILAFIFSVMIEYGVNYLFLRSRFTSRDICRMTLKVNVISYIMGTIFIYGICFWLL